MALASYNESAYLGRDFKFKVPNKLLSWLAAGNTISLYMFSTNSQQQNIKYTITAVVLNLLWDQGPLEDL